MNEFVPSEPAMFANAISLKRLVLLLAVIAAGCLGAAATAHAQSARTWVSGVGTNNTQCSVTAPCQSFAQAIAVTSSGGEIDCLDPGDFGPVTIGIPVTIDCEVASNGGITGTGGTLITINTTGTVNLIGLNINGGHIMGGIGVLIQSNGMVNIRNCKIYGFMFGIRFQPTSSGGNGNLVVDNVLVADNSYGIDEISNVGTINMTVRNSNVSLNAWGIIADSEPTHAGATIEQTTVAFNSQYGVEAESSGAVVLLGGSTVVNNGIGVYPDSGTIYSFNNNQIGGNGADIPGPPITTYPGGPLN